MKHEHRNPGEAALSISLVETAKLLGLTAQLYEVEAADNFSARLLSGLRSIIPFEVGECYVVDRDHQIVSACAQPERPIALPRVDEFRRLARLHPLNPLLMATPGKAFTLSDVVPLKDFLASDLYRTVYRPRRVNREISALLPDQVSADAPAGGAEGLRSGFLRISLRRWGAEFSEAERARLNLLLPIIQTARDRLVRLGGRGSAGRTHAGAAGDHDGTVFRDEAEFHGWVRSDPAWPLTRRESDVMYWLSQGKTNAEIGQILGMAERTAETHALRSYPKIGVENRHGAIALITRLSLQRLPSAAGSVRPPPATTDSHSPDATPRASTWPKPEPNRPADRVC